MHSDRFIEVLQLFHLEPNPRCKDRFLSFPLSRQFQVITHLFPVFLNKVRILFSIEMQVQSFNGFLTKNEV